MEDLSTTVAVILALSVASERFVEIVKGLIPFLNGKSDDPKKEGWRTAGLQVMAVVAGIVTTLLCQPALTKVVPETWSTFPGILALGLLASGGSGFWNSIQSYVLGLKDVQAVDAKKAQKTLREI
jgi:drug/metabolite transporter (DMT)-like permease